MEALATRELRDELWKRDRRIEQLETEVRELKRWVKREKDRREDAADRRFYLFLILMALWPLVLAVVSRGS